MGQFDKAILKPVYVVTVVRISYTHATNIIAILLISTKDILQ